ncbi:hypothetical protein [Oscillatoria sp. FACHB-1406]|uniref:hypothetical protein n=1 Tax=Oscillatoria sp. FACHB-1406 TaxID=2692846 RepID=UPI001683CEF2|nr:hypothetical protein [Oscillatoria sp. FACHB-1406]MBD2579916.1 hypothetical protein [Oscillatoria sp. FACHB-1406]
MTVQSPLVCPYLSFPIACKECVKVEKQWNVKRLVDDLNEVKCQSLTKSEVCWLRLLIYGLSPEEIAQKLSLTNSHIKSALSTSIYRYVESLTERELKKYSQVRLFLQEEDKYEKVEFELVISRSIELSEAETERLKSVIQKLGIQFPIEFRVVKIDENKNNDS